MKKTALFFVMVLMCAYIVNAVSIDMKSSYLQGETILTSVYGNILTPIAKEQIHFRRGHVEVPLDFGIVKVGEKYYIWAIAPQKEENYTLWIENVATSVDGIAKKVDYTKNFSVLANLSDYSVKPGAIFAKEDFSVNLFLYEDNKMRIPVDFPYAREVEIMPGDNEIKFDISESSSFGAGEIKVGRYSIPVYLAREGKKTDRIVGKSIAFMPWKIERVVLIKTGETRISYPLLLKNNGDVNLSNLSFEFNKEYFEVPLPEKNFVLLPDESYVFSINVTEKAFRNKTFYDVISAKAGEASAKLNINLNFTDNESLVSVFNKENKILYSCVEYANGSICSVNMKCDGDTISALNGACCLGTCKSTLSADTSKKSSWGWFFIAIALVVGVAIFIWYSRIKNAKNPLQKKVEDIEKREK